MATQYIDKNNNVVPNALCPKGSYKDKVPSTGTSAQSAVFERNMIIRLTCDGDCHYEIGTNPVATSDDNYLGASNGEQIRVDAGDRIAVIGSTINLYIREMV